MERRQPMLNKKRDSSVSSKTPATRFIKMQALATQSLWIKSSCHVAFCILAAPPELFPYPEGLPTHRLSSVQWFRSSAPQSRYPGPECYHCKQRDESSVLKSHILFVCYLYAENSGRDDDRRCFPVDNTADGAY